MNITESGKNALLVLSGGDMRRVLNLLQATHMAYPEINETVVYVTAGAAIPSVIQSMLHSLLNDNFETAYNTINTVCELAGQSDCTE